MRAAIVVSLLLLVIVPTSTAGPIGLIPVSEHESGCEQEDSWVYEYEWDPETGAVHTTSEAAIVDACSTSDSISADARFNGDEVIAIEAREETWSGYESTSEDAWWDDYQGNGGYEGSGGYRAGTANSTQVEARIAGQAVTARSFCEEISTGTYEGEGSTENWSRAWSYRSTNGTNDGCGESVDAGVAQAGHFDGCRESWAWADSYDADSSSYLFEGGSSCGQHVDITTLAGNVAVRRGSGCGYAWEWSDGGNSSAYEDRSDCAQGTWVDAAGSRVLVDGREWGQSYTCDENWTCTGAWHENAGLVIVRTPYQTVVVPPLVILP